MKYIKKDFLILLAALIICSVKPFSIAAEEGVTDKEIHIGMAGPQTGPAAPWGIVNQIASFYIEMINKEGGIHGRKVIIHSFDDAYNPASTKAGVKEYQEKIKIFAWLGIIGSETALSVIDYFENKKIPLIGPMSGASVWINPPHKYVFTFYPSYIYESSAFCRYAVKHMNKKRIAIIYINDLYGKTGLEGARKEMAELGMDMVAQFPVERETTFMKSYADKLMGANADTVIMFLTPFQCLNLIQYAKNINFFPQWMGSSTLSDFNYLSAISGGEFIKNMISSNSLEFNNSSILLKYKKAYKEITGKDNWEGPYFVVGITFSEIMVEGLKRAGRDLTREHFVKAMEGIHNHKLATGNHISYKPFDQNDSKCREGMNEVYLIQYLGGGKIKILTRWIKPGKEIIPIK